MKRFKSVALRVRVVTPCFLMLSLLMGCGGEKIKEADARTVAQRFESAVQAAAQGNHARAVEDLGFVIASGGVSPEEMVEAYLLRIESALALGNLDQAKVDLAVVEQAYTDECRFMIVKGKVHRAEGDTVGAAKAFARAKELNPMVMTPL